MKRAITAFVDDANEWVAILDCLHRQHVRHRPPFRTAPWVRDDAAREARIGTDLDCPLCDRTELPDGLEVVRRTDTWDAETVPVGLRRDHRVGAGTWGLLHVVAGEVRFQARTTPPTDVVVAGRMQPIPPGVEHHVEPTSDARFYVEFLRPPAHTS